MNPTYLKSVTLQAGFRVPKNLRPDIGKIRFAKSMRILNQLDTIAKGYTSTRVMLVKY